MSRLYILISLSEELDNPSGSSVIPARYNVCIRVLMASCTVCLFILIASLPA